MKKKGFTLIELLAVIVILAIIALILIPKINDLIESSRYASAVDSVLSYVSGANNQAAADVGIGGFENFSLSIPDTLELETGIDDDELEKIQYKGKGPTYVYLHFAGADKYVAEGKFCIWGYSIDYDSDEGATRSLLNYCEEKEPEGELTCDVLNNNAYDSTTNFKIKSVEDLVCISEMSKSGKNFSGKTIYLAKNIDFNNNASYLNINDKTYGDINGDGTIDGIKTEVTTAAGFLPIGSSTTFTGTFEGYGKSISNLYINRDQTGVGLFGNNQGKIVGLMLFDVNIKGGSRVGAVAGNNNGGTINEVIISGKVTGTGNDIGGAVGYQNRGSVATSILIRDIEVTGSESAGIVSDGWYSTVTGVVESGSVSYRCTTDNTGAADVRVMCSSAVSYEDDLNYGCGFNPGIDMLNSYDKVLDTYIGGDNDRSGYYFDYESKTSSKIVLKTTELAPLSFTLKGEGTDENPYIIDSYKHYKEAALVSKGSYKFKITNDIDFTDKKYYSLGTQGNPLGSDINGDMHTLSNITIGGADYSGLVSSTNGHTIEGLYIDNIKVNTNSSYVGAIAGSNNGVIKGITLTGVDVSGISKIGGVAGSNQGGTVNEIIISGKVTGTSGDIGGAVGYQKDGGSYAKSILVKDIEVTGPESAGIVSDGWYSTVTGVVESGNISYRCTTDNTGAASVTVMCSTASSYSEESNYNSLFNPGTYMLNSYDRVLDTYIGGDNDDSKYYFDYENENSSNIIIKRFKDYPIKFTLAGSGSSDDPYIIDSYNHYKEATINSKGNYKFKITSDIDFAGKHYYSLGTQGNPLCSDIDGDMHTLSNIVIDGADYTGLVSSTNGHTIEGLNINNITIKTTNSYIGAIAGTNNGLIKGINITGADISGVSKIGGVAGNNRDGSIYEVTVSGKVVGTGNDIGGVVGYQYGGGSYAKSLLTRDITVTGSDSAGLVSDGWYSTVTGVVESGNISYRCTTDNTGAASVTVRCSNKTTYSNEGNWGTSYNLIPPTTVTYTSSGNTIEVDSLSYYDSVGVLDTYIGGDGDETGYYMDYNNSGDRIIAVKASSSSGSSSGGSGSGSGSGGAGEPIIGDSVGTNPPTCVLERVIPRSAGIQAILTCEDEEGAPTIRSQWNVNKNATTTQFSDIGIVKEGSVNGNSKTVSPYWSTSNTISVPTPNTCYYYRFGAMDASGNWSYYVSDKCYYGFSN